MRFSQSMQSTVGQCFQEQNNQDQSDQDKSEHDQNNQDCCLWQ